MTCVVRQAMPKEYLTTEACFKSSQDAGEALLCSTGKEDLRKNYVKLKQLSSCLEKAEDSTAKGMNNALGDLQHGIGKNNEVTKASNAVSGVRKECRQGAARLPFLETEMTLLRLSIFR